MKKKKDVAQILITTNTLSSSKVISKFRFKKVVHKFFPIDTNYHTNKFLDYWKPSVSMFIDSEVWPNMLFNLNRKKIPIILLNARLTNKSFERWKRFKKFSIDIFEKFDLCMCSNLKTKIRLKKLGAKNIKYFGNLKFSQSESDKIEINNNMKKFIKTKNVWCASSTHNTEESFIGLIHKKLKTKYKNLLTIIIPRHINRINEIKSQLNRLGLKFHLHEPNKKISKDTDIYLVNAYGQTKSFFSISKNVFLGGSLINHGGQNPLEAVRYGCNILHGPNISNFEEIYEFLNYQKISFKVQKQNSMLKTLDKLLSSKKNKKKNIKDKIFSKGKKILDLSFREINHYLK